MSNVVKALKQQLVAQVLYMNFRKGHLTLKHWTRLPTTTHSTSTRTKSRFFLKSSIISL